MSARPKLLFDGRWRVEKAACGFRIIRRMEVAGVRHRELYGGGGRAAVFGNPWAAGNIAKRLNAL